MLFYHFEDGGISSSTKRLFNMTLTESCFLYAANRCVSILVRCRYFLTLSLLLFHIRDGTRILSHSYKLTSMPLPSVHGYRHYAGTQLLSNRSDQTEW